MKRLKKSVQIIFRRTLSLSMAFLLTAAAFSALLPARADAAGKFRSVSERGYYLRGVIPGWGQYYAGYHVKGMVFLGSFGLSGGIFTWSLVNMIGKKQSYDDLGYGTDQAVFDKKWKDYKNAGIVALCLGLFMGGIYAANWVDLIFFSHYTGKKTGAGQVSFEVYQYCDGGTSQDTINGIKAVFYF